MTDRYKGFLVTLEKDISSENAEHMLNALRMVKGVSSVKPYVKGMEDYMSEENGRMAAAKEVVDFIRESIYGLKKGKEQS